MRSRKMLGVLAFGLAMSLMFLAGWYRNGMSDAEAVHVSINYPAKGKAVGGIGTRATTGMVVVNLDRVGLLKRILQPNVVNLSTHWLRNMGDRPRRIRLATEGFTFPTSWDSTERTWDEKTHTIGRKLMPRQTVTVDWLITLPRPLPTADVLMRGKIVVFDADTGQRLSAIPVNIVQGKGGDCCAK